MMSRRALTGLPHYTVVEAVTGGQERLVVTVQSLTREVGIHDFSLGATRSSMFAA